MHHLGKQGKSEFRTSDLRSRDNQISFLNVLFQFTKVEFTKLIWTMGSLGSKRTSLYTWKINHEMILIIFKMNSHRNVFHYSAHSYVINSCSVGSWVSSLLS